MSWVLTEMIDLPDAGRRLHLFDTLADFLPKYSSPTTFTISPVFSSSSIATASGRRLTSRWDGGSAAKPYVLIRKGVLPDSLIDAPTIAYLLLDMNWPGP
jgi:hypothetical protein